VKVEAEQVATKAVPLKSVDLPGGQKLDAPEGGLIASLSAYLSEPDAPAGKAFVMEAVSFERDSATLAPTSENQLRQLADVLSAYPRVKVRVEGHTDVSGDTATVRALSAERAATIKAALIMAGVADERIQSQGFGAERPLTKEQTAAAKASNRRVELVIAER
jgi:outer membrane protein OmpA-like peptidoglycan-associated protein